MRRSGEVDPARAPASYMDAAPRGDTVPDGSSGRILPPLPARTPSPEPAGLEELRMPTPLGTWADGGSEGGDRRRAGCGPLPGRAARNPAPGGRQAVPLPGWG